MSMTSEGDVKKAVKSVFSKVSVQYPNKLWFFMPPANGYGRSGIPDFIGVFNGRAFAVETKFGAGKVTAHQMREIEGLTQAGTQCWVVREASFDGFELEFQGWAALCS